MNKLQTEFNHPCIAVIQMDYTFNMFLVVEREIVYNVESVFQAVKVLLVSYYVFNIAYPNLLGGLFVFLLYYVFKVKPKERVPVSVSQLCSVIDI